MATTHTPQPTVTRTKTVRYGKVYPAVKVYFPTVGRTVTLLGPIRRKDDAIREAAGYLDQPNYWVGQS